MPTDTLKSRRTRTAFCAVGLATAGVLLSLSPAVLRLDENLGLGLLFTVRGTVSPPGDVVVVSISRDSAAAVGQPAELDRWQRSLHAELLDSLAAAGAEAVAFDVFFEEPRADDAQLAAAIARAGNVVLGERIEQDTVGGSSAFAGLIESRVPPVDALGRAALGSAPFALPTIPYSVGQFWTFGPSGDLPSLPAVALQAYLLRYYDDFGALLGSARPNLNVPTSRAEVLAAHDLPATMRALRAAFASDASLAADLRTALDGRPSDTTSRALRALLGLYAGAGQPLSRLLRARAHDPHDPVRRRGALACESRSQRQDGVRRRLRAATVGTARLFSFGLLGADGRELERRRDRRDGVREPARAASARPATDLGERAVRRTLGRGARSLRRGLLDRESVRDCGGRRRALVRVGPMAVRRARSMVAAARAARAAAPGGYGTGRAAELCRGPAPARAGSSGARPLRAAGRRPAPVGAERASIAGAAAAAGLVPVHGRRELHGRRGDDECARARRAHGRLFQRSIARREGARRLRGRRDRRRADRGLGSRGAVRGISAPRVPSRARHRRGRRRVQLAALAAIADSRRRRVRRAAARQLRSASNESATGRLATS